MDNNARDTENNNNSKKDEVKRIIVNGREKTWEGKKISYEDIVILAFESFDQSENISYTVTFSRRADKEEHGSMIKGDSIPVKEGMIFNVTKSNRS